MITIVGGHKIRYHPNFSLPDLIYHKMTDKYKQCLRRESIEYRE